MAASQLPWLAGLFTFSIAANAGLLKVITDDKIPRPNVVAGYLNTLLSAVGGFFCYVYIGLLVTSMFVTFNLISFLIIVYIVSKRDKKAVLFAEKLLPTLYNIDLQIAFILSEISKHGGSDPGRPIRRALRYILSEIPVLLGFDSTHHIEACILLPKEFCFSVVAYMGIPNYKVKKMEELFRYGSNSVSVAGYAVNERKTIVINDLADSTNSDGQYWIKISSEESKNGSMLAHPIFRGIGTEEGEPIAVLCITSLLKNAFNVKETNQLLNLFSMKVEVLQNAWDIVQSDKQE